MGDVPFGFGRDDDSRPDENDKGPGKTPEPAGASNDPFAALFGGGGAPQDMGAAFQRLGQLLSWQGGPVNWDLARDVARQAVSASGDRSVSGGERMEGDWLGHGASELLSAYLALPADLQDVLLRFVSGLRDHLSSGGPRTLHSRTSDYRAREPE